MTRKLWISIASVAVGTGLLVAAGVAGAAPSSVGAKQTAGAQKGGTLRVNISDGDFEYTDPGLAYDTLAWSMLYQTNLMLLNFPDQNGAAGSKLVPEAATAFPTVSADGKTYTYTIKSGLKFSDGSPVTAAAYQRAIYRSLSPQMKQGSPVAVNINLDTIISGASDFVAGKTQSISGVKAAGQKLTITLTRPTPYFVSLLAMPWFGAVKPDMAYSATGLNSYPAAGPYYIKARDIGKTLELDRNPYYKGNRPANPDQIVFTVGLDENQNVLQVRAGQADVAIGLPPTANESLGSEFGVNKKQYWAQPGQCVLYEAMNTTRAPFDTLNVRKAFEWGIDRPALVRVAGKYAGKRYDHIIPPGMTGYRNFHQYAIAGANPDMAKKVGGSGISGYSKDIVVVYPQTGQNVNRAQVVQFNLKQMGFQNVKLSPLPSSVYYKTIGTKGGDFDVQWGGWCPDFNDPYDYINVLFDGRNIQASNNTNHSYFDNAQFNKLLDAASATSGDARDNAYAKLDFTLMKDYAPMAPFQVSNVRYFVSSRVGNMVYVPYFQNPDYGALTVG
jgi:peptide/nickel transport system substrate-binding protein